MADLEFLFLLLLGAAALVRGAAWLHVPYPIALVLVGLAAGAVPGLPEVRVDPEVVFLVFLPPLLGSAGFYSSPRELRAELRPLRSSPSGSCWPRWAVSRSPPTR